MEISRTGNDIFRMRMTPAECRIIVNCMKATFENDRGEGVAAYEYPVRVGASMDEVRQAISMIEKVLSTD
jgi:hypothetical protein